MMTTEPSSSESRPRDQSDLQDDPTIWSQRFLGWNPVDPKSSRAEFLRRLTERDYFLTRDETDATLFLASPDSLELTDCVREQLAERGKSIRLKDSVRCLAEEFFDLVFAERKRKLNQLKVLCSDELALLEWLDKLSSALDVDRPTMQGDQAFDRLVSACIEIFVAVPSEASRIRQEFIHASREEPEFWGRAAIMLHLNHNQFTLRVAPWTRKLADWQQVERRYQQTLENLNRSVFRDQEAARELDSRHVEREVDRSQTHDSPDRIPIEDVFIALVVFALFQAAMAVWNLNSHKSESTPQSESNRPVQVQFPDPETIRQLRLIYPPDDESTSKVDEKSPQLDRGVNAGNTTPVNYLLRMSPEERAAEFARDPRMKMEFERTMKAVSAVLEILSNEKSDAAGKSSRSESDDQ